MSTSNNLPPELTARIERLADEAREEMRNHAFPALILARYMRILAEPLHKEMEELKSQLERERMCHAACGVIAMSNTPEALARVRDMHPDYLSASVQDCIRVVEREISLKAQLADTEASRQEYIRLFHEQERENDELEKKYSAVSSAYNELIMAVGRKFPGEIRHDTALRYIKRAEELSDAGPACQPNQEPS